jgi:hypothetical protein
MADDSPDSVDNAAIARRLRILRHHVAGSGHGSRAAFAAQTGIEYKRWNNFEREFPMPRDMAIHLVKAIHGLTLDWIYLGRQDGKGDLPPARPKSPSPDRGRDPALPVRRQCCREAVT